MITPTKLALVLLWALAIACLTIVALGYAEPGAISDSWLDR